MARCGCSGAACNCVLVAGTDVTISGAGTAASPYIISSSAPTLTFTNTNTVDLVRVGDDVTATVNLDPAAGNLITANVDGLRLDCDDVTGCLATVLNVVDTPSLDLSLTGTGTAADPWFLSGIANAGVPTTVANTNSVNLTQVAGLITADVNISGAAGNILQSPVAAGGLLADIIVDCTLQGEGTAASPLGSKPTFIDVYQSLVVQAASVPLSTLAGGFVNVAEHAVGPSLAFNVTNTSCRFMRVRVEVGISHMAVRKNGSGRTQFLLGARINSTGGIAIAATFGQNHQSYLNDSSDATTDIVWDTTSSNYLSTLFVMAPLSVAAMTLQGTMELTSTTPGSTISNFNVFTRITGYEV